MTTFRKIALKPGTYHSPDGKVEITADRLKHWRDTFRRMSEAKQVIPCGWDHATTMDGLAPVDAESFKSAKNTVGRLTKFDLHGDGEAAELVFEITDPTAVQRAERNEVFVSPVILDGWKDGAGNEYLDCITHVDLVNHPVDHSQGAFETVTGILSCGLRMGLDTRVYRMAKQKKAADSNNKNSYHWITTPDGDPVLAPPINRGKGGRKGRKGKGKKKMSLSLAYIRMGDFPEEEGDTKPDTKPDAGDEGAENIETGYDKMDEILDLLEQNYQVVIPEDTDDSNLLERLHAALLTASAHLGNGPTEPDQEEPVSAAQPEIATMSAQSRASLAYAERTHRKDLSARLDGLLKDGRCTPDEANKRRGEIVSVRLSLDGNGEPVATDIEKWLDDRVLLPAGTFWDDATRTRMSAEAAEHPRYARSDYGQGEAADIAAWALGRKVKSS